MNLTFFKFLGKSYFKNLEGKSNKLNTYNFTLENKYYILIYFQKIGFFIMINL